MTSSCICNFSYSHDQDKITNLGMLSQGMPRQSSVIAPLESRCTYRIQSITRHSVYIGSVQMCRETSQDTHSTLPTDLENSWNRHTDYLRSSRPLLIIEYLLPYMRSGNHGSQRCVCLHLASSLKEFTMGRKAPVTGLCKSLFCWKKPNSITRS